MNFKKSFFLLFFLHASFVDAMLTDTSKKALLDRLNGIEQEFRDKSGSYIVGAGSMMCYLPSAPIMDWHSAKRAIENNQLRVMQEVCFNMAHKPHATKLIEILLDAGVSANYKSADSGSLLWRSQGVEETVKLLKARGAHEDICKAKYRGGLP